MTVLVIDDESAIHEGLDLMLSQSSVNVESVFHASTVSDGYAAIMERNPDVVLLDVEIGEERGFDVLNKLQDYKFQLIFITAHNEYALDAFRFSAIDFLLKPIDSEELDRALGRAQERIRERFLAEQLSVLRDSLETLKNADKKIVLRDHDSLHFVKVSDIIKCEADSSYTKVFLANAKVIVISRTLKEYETLLAPYGFIRTHHSHIVNIHRILRFDKADGGELILDSELRAPVSQRKREYILELLAP